MEDNVRHNEVVGASPTRWGSVAASLRNGTLKGLVLAVVLAGVFGVALPTQAGEIANFFGIVLASLLQVIIGFVGDFFLLIVTVLINVATYNDFVVAVPVEQGWTIVRDVTNMFFILVLLAIAFGTILGVKEWSYADKRLSGLLVMAVVVNFSRTICGLLIDFSQVVMLTFVYGFREAAGANFFTGLQLNKALESPLGGADAFLQKTATEAIKTSTSVVFGAVVALILALLMIGGACVIVMYLTLMLIVRIVYLWLLIVLSPLAFFMKVVPGSMAKGQYADWWKRFNSQLVFGPLMAFFLWLSLVSVSSGSQLFKGVGSKTDTQKVSQSYSDYTFDGGQSAAFTSQVIQEYLIGLCLMAGGAMLAQQMAGASGSVAKTAGGAGVKAGFKAAKGAYRGAKWTGGEMGRYAGMLPAGAKDPTTGMRPRLSDRVGAWQQGRQDKKQAKVDLKDDETNLRKLSALRAGGPKNAAAASALEKDLVGQGAQRLGKSKTPKDLQDIMNDDSKSNIERQRAMLALAQKGDDSLKGKGAALTGMVAKVGGSKDFELQTRQALKEKGDQDAMVMNAKQIQDKMAASTAKQNANSLEGIANGVQLGPDGKPKQTHAADKLLAIDKDQYDTKDFSNRLKQQIQDALLIATELETDPNKKSKLAEKYNELTNSQSFAINPDGSVAANQASGARTAELMAGMQGKLAAGRIAEAQMTGAQYSSTDRAAGDLIRGDSRSEKALDRVRNMRERLSAGEEMTDADRAGLQQDINTLKAVGASNYMNVNPDIRNADGSKKNGADIVASSQMVNSMQAAVNATDSTAAANSLKAAALALEDAARKAPLSGPERQARQTAMQNGATGLQRAENNLDKALSTGTTKEKLGAINKAATQGASAITILMKQEGGMGSELKSELSSLKAAFRALEQKKALSATDSQVLQQLKGRLAAARKKIT